MKIISFKLLIIFLLFSSACVLNLPSKTDFSYGCITEEPDRNEIVGTWIADKSTLEDMQGRGLYSPSVIPKLIFHENGEVEAIEMPDWWLTDSGESYRSFEPPFSGNWKFYRYKDESCFGVNLNLSPVSTNMSLGKNRFSQNPKYTMTKYIGDADEDHLMVFVKEK